MCRDVKTLHQVCGCTVVRTQYCQRYYDNKSQEKEKAKGFFSRLLSSPKKSKPCKRGATADINEASDGLCGKCYANSVRTNGKIVQGENGPRIVFEGIKPSRTQPTVMKETSRQARGPVIEIPLHSSSIPRKPAATISRGNAFQQLGTPFRGPAPPLKQIATYLNKPLPSVPNHSIISKKPAGTLPQNAGPLKPTSSKNKLIHAETTRARRPTPSEELRGPGWKSDKLYFADELIEMGCGSSGPQRNKNRISRSPELKSDKLYFTDELIDMAYGSSGHYSKKDSATHSQESDRKREEIKLWPNGRTPRRPRGPMVPVRIPPNVATGYAHSGAPLHVSENLNGSGSKTTSSGNQHRHHRYKSNLSQSDSDKVPSANRDTTREAEARRPRRHVDSYYDVNANKAVSAMPGFFGSDGSSDQVDPIMDMINDVESQWNQAVGASSQGQEQAHQRPRTRGRRLL